LPKLANTGAALDNLRRMRAYSASSNGLASVTKSPVKQMTSGLACKPSATEFSINANGTTGDA
jgi:hypothetical protein